VLYLEILLSRVGGEQQDRPVASGNLKKSVARILASASLFSFVLCLLFTSGCGVTLNTVPLTVQPNSISFGDVAVGQSQMVTVTVSNPGYTAVNVSDIQSDDAAFAPTGLASTIPAGGTSTFKVAFAPSASKSYSSQILIASAAGTTKVPVSGSGHQGGSPNPPASKSTLSVSATSLQFGSETVGTQEQQSLTLTAVGNTPVNISSITLSGGSFQAVPPALPATLKGGQSLTMPVQFIPKSTGSAQGMLTIASDAANTPSVAVSLSGVGVIATSAGVPALTLSPANVAFATVPIGSRAVSSVTLTSSGTANLVVQGLSTKGSGFTTGQLALPVTLPPGQQISLPVTFAPGSVGAAQGQITVMDNATTGSTTIGLSGTGATAGVPSIFANPTSLDFGDQTVASNSFKTITLVSNGAVPATVKSVTVSGQDFTSAVQGLPAVLQPNQQLSIKVQFIPAVVGQASGTVTIVTDAATPTTVVNLLGNGVAPRVGSLAASATSLSFGSVTIGTKAAKTVTVTSTGTASASITAGSVSGNGYTATYGGVPVQNLAGPITLQPGQQASFAVAFDAVAAGASSGQLTLQTDTGSPLSVSLAGIGAAAPSPALTMSVTSLDFGDVQVNTQETLQVTLASSGTAPVTISSTAIAGAQFGIASSSFPAGITSLPATLDPGQQITLNIAFQPTATGAVTGDLTVSSDASGAATNVALTGNGVPAPAPKLVLSATTLNFGSTQLGSKTTQALTITSGGTAPLTISRAAITGTQFTDGNPSLPITLQPGQQMALTLDFDPATAGADAETLTITSNATPANVSVSLGGTGTTAATPQLTASATSLSFGSVTVNSGSMLPLTLTSSGTAPVTITSETASGAGYSVSGSSLPLTLSPGQTVTLQLTFNPTVAGAASGNLAINSNASSGLLQVAMSGTGAAIATPQLTASATSLNFGSVTVNSGATLPLTLTSSGTAPATISATTVSGASYSVSGAALPLTLNPGQTATLQLTFDPTVAGAATGALAINSNAMGGLMQVALSGTGAVIATPQLTASSASLSFGNVTVNTGANLPLTLTSSGTAPVTISAPTVSGAGYTVSGSALPVTLSPGQTTTLQVTFDPTVAGTATGSLAINSNATSGTIHVALSGTGTAPLSPQLTASSASLSFGNVTVNTSATLPLILTSSGTAAVTISAATVSGTGYTVAGSSLPLTLNPGQATTLQLTFDPTVIGAATGALAINNNGTSGTIHVTLNGTGAAALSPQLTVSPTSLAFGDVTLNTTSSLQVTLSSSGTASVTVSAATLSGAGFAASGATFPVTVSPGQAVTIQVHFDPTVAGAASGQLAVTSNSASNGTALVQITGNGVAVQHSIDLNWNAPTTSTDPVAGYNIYRSTNGGATFTKLNGSVDTVLDYTDSNVQSGTTYTYVVKGVDASGQESGPSNQISLPVP
jgi:hypothetical protein